MTNKIEINIDLLKLADIARVGVRRAVLLMGLGSGQASRVQVRIARRGIA
jgi:hypothetical protein